MEKTFPSIKVYLNFRSILLAALLPPDLQSTLFAPSPLYKSLPKMVLAANFLPVSLQTLLSCRIIATACSQAIAALTSYQVDLVGGYYGGGDNVKSSSQIAYSMTMLSWSVLEFGSFMESELPYAMDEIRWGTDFLLKATNTPGKIYVQIGNYSGQNCWQRPEDMDGPRELYVVSKETPGSDVAAEIASALAAFSMVFKQIDPAYSAKLLERAEKIFEFADENQGSYLITLGPWVCPSGCSAEYQVDLSGGYYGGGDNVKSSSQIAYSMTMLSWSVLEFGSFMESELPEVMDRIRGGTDFLLKATNTLGKIYVQIGNYSGQNCWQRPEDMDGPRELCVVSKEKPGSDVAAEIASALAASSMVFKQIDPAYSAKLLERAEKIFEFADENQGSYLITVGPWVCPSGCSAEYQDELIWAAAWLYNATKFEKYQNYIFQNMSKLEASFSNGRFAEFGWNNKHAGINVLISKLNMTDTNSSHLFFSNADKLVCSLLPESGTSSVSFLQGGLLFKEGGSSLGHAAALSFLLLVHRRTLGQARRQVHCGETIVTPERLTEFARRQVNYILGNNPLRTSFMVGYGKKYPQRIRHKASSLPSKSAHPKRIDCKEGLSYYNSSDPNPNLLIGAVVGGPDINGKYVDSRDSVHSEPSISTNAPLVGVLAYLKFHH